MSIQEMSGSTTRGGLEFNYAVWTPNSTITLSTVPWSNDYRDIVNFETQQALDEYLGPNNGPSVTINNTMYIRQNTPVRVNIPFGNAFKYNYLRVHNPAQPIGSDLPTTFYYFILDVRHIAPHTTELVVQLDVWQSFGRDIRFGRCYVERGHIGIANKDSDVDNGRRYLSIAEGLDTGADQIVVGSKYVALKNPNIKSNLQTNTSAVVMVSTVDLEASGGTVDAPVLKSAKGSEVVGMPSGASLYFFASTLEFSRFLDSYSDKPWVTQGIIGLYLVPNMFDPASMGTLFNSIKLGAATAYTFNLGAGFKSEVELDIGTDGFKWRDVLLKSLPRRYRHLTKFLTHPYSSVQFTAFNAQPLVMRPEYLGDVVLRLIARFHLTPPNPRVVIMPVNYNSGDGSTGLGYSTSNEGNSHTEFTELGEDIDFSTTISNLPQLPLVNNAYLNYMASNNAQIAFQYQNAEWSQTRAMQGNQLGFNQATARMGLSGEMTDIANSSREQSNMLANETLAYRSVQGGLNSVIGGALQGNAGSAVLGAANAAADYAIGANNNNKSTAINNALASRSNDAAVGNMGYVRDTNKTYADWAAQGDYANTVAGINARIQDTKMLQPTTSGQLSGEAFAFIAHQGFKGRVVCKRLDNASIMAIGEFWLRYGYAVNRFHFLDNLMVMENFTYWKLHESNIQPNSKCPESYRTTIRGIFEKGVTVWKSPEYINNLDIGLNNPKEGIKL